MGFAFPTVVTISVAGVGADEYGNPIPFGYTTVTARGDVQPVRTDENIDGINALDTNEVRFYLEPGTTVSSGDKLTADSLTYEAIGPADERAYGGRLDYVRVRARRSGPLVVNDVDAGDATQVFVEDIDGGEI